MNITKDIALICDDNYCLPTTVCIQSIIDTYKSDEQIIIHVCTFGLNDDNVEILRRMGNQTIKVVNHVFAKNDFESKLKRISQNTHVTPTALIKFELPDYFNYLDSILYLDSDVVVKSDISELLQMEINDCYLAASYEFGDYLTRIQFSLRRKPSDEFYFNSGVMLLNLRKMREELIPDLLWEYKFKKAKTKLMDQESLNAVCSSKTLHLPIKWNFNPIFNTSKYIKLINRVYGTEYQNVTDLETDVRIVHYVGARDKPWKYKSARMRNYWDVFFNKTPYVCNLQLDPTVVERRPFLKAFNGRVREHGLWATICYIVYCIEMKLNAL